MQLLEGEVSSLLPGWTRYYQGLMCLHTDKPALLLSRRNCLNVLSMTLCHCGFLSIAQEYFTIPDTPNSRTKKVRKKMGGRKCPMR